MGSLVIPPAMLGGLVIIKAAALAAAGIVLGAGSWARAHEGILNGQGQRQGGGRYRHRRRRVGRRSSPSNQQDDDGVFSLVARTEVDQCYRRYICDLATGGMAGTAENDVILSLFGKEEEEHNDDNEVAGSSLSSPKIVYAEAARFGKRVKDIRACEARYSCPLDGPQINKLLLTAVN